MRWDALFADLEAQLDAAADDVAAMHAERVRAEVAGVELRDRLRAAPGQRLVVRLDGGSSVEGVLSAAGPDWLLVREATGEALVPLAAVALLQGLTRSLAAPPGVVEGRLGLASALRGLARDRSPVTVWLRGHPPLVLTGTVDRVGADHLDLAQHPVDEPRRQGAVRGVVVVPVGALGCVRRSG
ncbi:hypothetical protein SAMN06264364_10527 [Quadrisphaera granulorum]|uniref:Fis family transcriptional regulator n=1 Tax=Quadrisphaera granulorum TaxID=317664 RepID=A0A316AAV0_9ACTN|nr:hypothetical protein [Quadrisphaera granulorum]PWJ54823.1 hypothetical protein BXY45_10527 [Quadrisphaera granulorum]SZE95769.1 hypothetical protein SAMN06264364_10527 [Quadrisphaera granulorum]